MIDTLNGSVRRLLLPGMDENDGVSKAKKMVSGESSKSSTYRICKEFSSEYNTLLFYQEQGSVTYLPFYSILVEVCGSQASKLFGDRTLYSLPQLWRPI